MSLFHCLIEGHLWLATKLIKDINLCICLNLTTFYFSFMLNVTNTKPFKHLVPLLRFYALGSHFDYNMG